MLSDRLNSLRNNLRIYVT